MSKDKKLVYTEAEWDDMRSELKLHDEERLAGIRCSFCDYMYLKDQETYKYCPVCGNVGPGHPYAELKDIE